MKRILAAVLMLVLVFGICTSSATADPNIVIVNPVNNSSSSTNSLLVSVKIMKACTVRVSVYEKMIPPQTASDGQVITEAMSMTLADYQKNQKAGTKGAKLSNRAVMTGESFVSASNLSFYTKKLADVDPGVYQVRVDTLNKTGAVIYSTYSITGITAPVGTNTANSTQTSSRFLMTLLQSIFGN